MKKLFSIGIYTSLLLILLSSCSSIEKNLTKEEAKTIALNKLDTSDEVPKITKVQKKRNKYVVYWEKKETKETGSVTINKVGKVVEQTHSIP